MTDHVLNRASERRFEFGKNWRHFLSVVNEERITEAERSLRELLDVDSLHGSSFLDVGSGSGLFSLAARRLGARVHSFDYDPESVACTSEMKRRFLPHDPAWKVEEGSVLDRPYVHGLGTFDIVYAWGALHHTGDMWSALENLSMSVTPGGALCLAIYNDQGRTTARWRAVKRLYNTNRLGRALVKGAFIPYFAGILLASDLARGRDPRKRYREYKRNRGMSLVHDWIDWLGGYPFETARPEDVFRFYRGRGFTLENLWTVGGNLGCNQFVFVRTGDV